MHHWNCRQKQRDVLGKMLHLNSASAPGKDPGDLYKVLILDRFSRDIIAPLLRVNDLRRHGVTLHLALEAERQPIPDVPAVYLVQPTQANIERIVKDAAAGLYEQVHVNFTSSLPSNLLQQLAQGMVKADAASKIAKLYDQYVSFIALEPNMFSLGMPDAYLQLNDPAAMDTHIEAVVTSIVDGLFALCVTLGVVPIIRCPKGGVAEHVATILDGKLRDALRGRNSLLSEGMSGLSATLTRPILCLFDRNFDLTSTLCHGWTYKPLVHDVLGLHLNRVTLPAEPVKPGAAGALAAAVKAVPNPSLDVDEHDFFWEACGTHAFPTMAEEVDTQVKRYKAAVDSISKQSATKEGAYVDPDELLKRNTKDLMAAVSSLPELQEQKKTLDKHTRMAHALLAAIKTRGLDAWHSTGEDVLAGKADLATVTKLVAGPRGTAADRLRLAIIWLLMCPGLPSDSDYSELETALRTAGCDTTALAYVRQLKRNNLVGCKAVQEGPASGNSMFNLVAQGIGKLLTVSRQAPLTLAVEALMDGKQGSVEHDTYAVFDPKAPAGRAGPERAKGPFREAIVFMIGGGSYLERETIVSWAAKANASSAQGGGVLGAVAGPSAQRHVLYGATEMLSGEQTLTQLAELGRLSGLGKGHISLEPAAAGQANGK